MDPFTELKTLKTGTPFVAKLFYWGAAFPWFVALQGHFFDWAVIILCIVESFPLYIIGGVIDSASFRRKQTRRDELAATILRQIENGGFGTFFLYLRPFIVTGRMQYPNPNTFEFAPTPDLEERLANGLINFGPLVSLGRQLEACGSSRILTSEESWREKLVSLLPRAKVIFMVPGYQEGTTWEMEMIKSGGHLNKTLLMVPIGDSLAELTAYEHWEMTSKAWNDVFGFRLPEYQGEKLFRISGNGEITEICSLSDMARPETAKRILDGIVMSSR